MNRKAFLTWILVTAASCALLEAQSDSLERGFQNPPESAKPRVWWHWLNGNVTKEGITADLEWMKRAGIAGFQMFDGSLGIPQFTEKRLVWMTPEWQDAFRHAGAEADRLGLEMSMAASGGWSETAGPWVKPEEAMKKVVWSETEVDGPRRFSGVLAHPPSVNGPFQDIPAPPPLEFPEMKDLPGAKYPPPTPNAPPPPPDPTFYADFAVIAYRTPIRELRMAEAHPRITVSSGAADTEKLMDGDLSKPLVLPFASGQPAWIQFEFPQPYRARAVFLVGGLPSRNGPRLPGGEIQASEDGANWFVLLSFPAREVGSRNPAVRTYTIPDTTARFYRVLLTPPPVDPTASLMGLAPPKQFEIAELQLLSGPRVNDWEDKAAFGTAVDPESVVTPPVSAQEAIAVKDVIDLTAKMRPDGTLDWDVPPGHWTILRMGYSLTGKKNHPATPEATGFEVDKLSRQHVETYVRKYVDMISHAAGPYFGKSFRYFLMDSWEAGQENWTEEMPQEFRKRRGYDLTPYLPVLTGHIVGNADISERFLWDYRRTIADLLAENHYRLATQYFHTKGVGLYAEAMGTQLPTTGDGLLNKGQVDIPMGEFWTQLPGQPDRPAHIADIREAASAAHIYGKPIVAAESFTSMPNIPGWGQSAFYLKPLGDRNLAMGVNRIVFHTSDHQPFVDEAHKPGITLWMFGQHYTRNITWAEQAVAWNTYLARCSYLLQQGQYVADAAYFYGEGAPATVPFWRALKPALPQGYSADFVNADVLLHRMEVQDGRLVLPGGMSYRVLVFPDETRKITLPLARKIRDLVSAGAILLAPKPVGSPSLADYPEGDREIQKIANEVWGAVNGLDVTEHPYGKGKVYWGRTIEDVLAAEHTVPDFEYTKPHFDTELVWAHRHTPEADIYFVANQRPGGEDLEGRFRVSGKEAELWHPDTGQLEPASYRIEGGRTVVPLHFDPYGSVFVVFRHPASSPYRDVPHPVTKVLATVEGPWELRFPPNWGAPPKVTLPKLISWTAYPNDDGVKYFSGTATYSRELRAPKNWFQPGTKIWLDLGTVKDFAEISVNGKAVGGILWKPPFQADITQALKPGVNRIEIKVTNLWPNRIIGDQQPSATKKYTWTDYRPYTKDSPLLESGLLGPVTVSAVTLQ